MGFINPLDLRNRTIKGRHVNVTAALTGKSSLYIKYATANVEADEYRLESIFKYERKFSTSIPLRERERGRSEKERLTLYAFKR